MTSGHYPHSEGTAIISYPFRIPDPDDIIGSCFVKDGLLVPETYQRMPSHRILSHLGPFQLSPSFFDKLCEELYKRLDGSKGGD